MTKSVSSSSVSGSSGGGGSSPSTSSSSSSLSEEGRSNKHSSRREIKSANRQFNTAFRQDVRQQSGQSSDSSPSRSSRSRSRSRSTSRRRRPSLNRHSRRTRNHEEHRRVHEYRDLPRSSFLQNRHRSDLQGRDFSRDRYFSDRGGDFRGQQYEYNRNRSSFQRRGRYSHYHQEYNNYRQQRSHFRLGGYTDQSQRNSRYYEELGARRRNQEWPEEYGQGYRSGQGYDDRVRHRIQSRTPDFDELAARPKRREQTSEKIERETDDEYEARRKKLKKYHNLDDENLAGKYSDEDDATPRSEDGKGMPPGYGEKKGLRNVHSSEKFEQGQVENDNITVNFLKTQQKQKQNNEEMERKQQNGNLKTKNLTETLKSDQSEIYLAKLQLDKQRYEKEHTITKNKETKQYLRDSLTPERQDYSSDDFEFEKSPPKPSSKQNLQQRTEKLENSPQIDQFQRKSTSPKDNKQYPGNDFKHVGLKQQEGSRHYNDNEKYFRSNQMDESRRYNADQSYFGAKYKEEYKYYDEQFENVKGDKQKQQDRYDYLKGGIDRQERWGYEDQTDERYKHSYVDRGWGEEEEEDDGQYGRGQDRRTGRSSGGLERKRNRDASTPTRDDDFEKGDRKKRSRGDEYIQIEEQRQVQQDKREKMDDETEYRRISKGEPFNQEQRGNPYQEDTIPQKSSTHRSKPINEISSIGRNQRERKIDDSRTFDRYGGQDISRHRVRNEFQERNNSDSRKHYTNEDHDQPPRSKYHLQENYRSRESHHRRRHNENDARQFNDHPNNEEKVAKIRAQEAEEQDKKIKEQTKPNFGLSGKLADETNVVKGVVQKYQEPPESAKPQLKWRFYVFKNDDLIGEPIPLHRQSCYIFGRERQACDVPIDHPMCSKQHAVLQFRKKDDASINPYVMDLKSANGTLLNGEKIEPERYYELMERDMLKFGLSSREYILLHEQSQG